MDINKIQQLFNKLDFQSEEIQFYFRSSRTGRVLGELTNKYNPTDQDLFFDLLNEFLISDFNLSAIDLALKNDFKDDNKVRLVAIDFIGMILLPLGKYIKQVDIAKELTRRGGVAANYAQYIQDFEDEMEDAGSAGMGMILDKYDRDLDKETEMRDAIDLFKTDLLVIFADDNIQRIIGLNGMLVYLLLRDKSFKRSLEDALLENQELITSKELHSVSAILSPSVGNWLKDFISRYGTGIFTNITLSEYLSGSENVKVLDQSERNLIAQLLVLYRNLKFFPETFAELSQEKWHIIPIEHLVAKLRQNNMSKPNVSNKNNQPDFDKMSPIELKAFMETNNLSKEDIEKLKNK